MEGIRTVGLAVVVVALIGGASAEPWGHWPGVAGTRSGLLSRLAGQASLGFRILRREPQPTVEVPGVEVLDRGGGGDGLYSVMVADIVAVAKQAMEETLPGRQIERIRVVLAVGRPWHENVVTDRDHTVYIRIGDHGMGEAMRADAGAIALLCEAVAELYNSARVPGLDRYMAHRYLVPAVVEQFGNDVIPTRHPSPLADDGMEMLQAITADDYTFVHPDLAAVAALMAVEDKVGLDGLRGLLAAASGEAEDPFGALREAAVAMDPELDGAFRAYDEATRFEPDDEGMCLVASFEPEEGMDFVEVNALRTRAQSVLLHTNPGIEWEVTDEWASHGSHSLKLEGDEEDEWMAVYMRDPDWKFRDLRRFSELELDMVVETPGPQEVFIGINDHVTDGHGQVTVLSETLLPGIWRRVTFPLVEEDLQGYQDMDAEYFGGQFRTDSVSRIYIGLSRPTQPITFYLDNLRLRLREEVEARGRADG